MKTKVSVLQTVLLPSTMSLKTMNTPTQQLKHSWRNHKDTKHCPSLQCLILKSLSGGFTRFTQQSIYKYKIQIWQESWILATPQKASNFKGLKYLAWGVQWYVCWGVCPVEGAKVIKKKQKTNKTQTLKLLATYDKNMKPAHVFINVERSYRLIKHVKGE